MNSSDLDKLANQLLPFILRKVRQASAVQTTTPAGGTMSAAQIMAAVQSLDGPGSGLDADTVDGSHASDFLANSLLTTRGDIIRRGASAPERLALTVPAANVLNVLAVANGETDPSWKALFDATNPAALTVSAAAAPGTSLLAAHRDHVHPITSSSNPGAAAALLASNASGQLQLVGLIAGYVRPAADSTTAIQLQTAAGAAVLTVDTVNQRLGIGTTPATSLELAGDVAQTAQVARRTLANSAGSSLTIAAGGATSGATDKAGGNLILQAGQSTGAGGGSILVNTLFPRGGLSAVAIWRAGTGYTVGDVLTIVQSGASNGQVTVTTVNGAGGITGVIVTAPGAGYFVNGAVYGGAITGGTGTSGSVYPTAITATTDNAPVTVLQIDQHGFTALGGIAPPSNTLTLYNPGIDNRGILSLQQPAGDIVLPFALYPNNTKFEIRHSLGAAYTRLWNATSAYMAFGTNNAERMRIESNGVIYFYQKDIRPSADSAAALQIQTAGGSAVLSADTTNKIITVTDSLIVNESGAAAGDFRAESDTEPNMLFLDASADTVQFGGTTNSVNIAKGGHLTLLGTARVWDDIRVEPTVRGTGVNNPTFSQWFTNGAGSRGVYLYTFDNAVDASEKEVFFTVQMPHSWAQTAIHLHVHWMAATTAASSKVRWGLEYTWAEPFATFGNTTLVYAADPEGGDTGTTQYKHMITEFAAMTPSSSQDGLSSVLICRLWRDSSDAADTYTGDVGLLYIDAHIELDKLGSNDEYA